MQSRFTVQSVFTVARVTTLDVVGELLLPYPVLLALFSLTSCISFLLPAQLSKLEL